MTTDVGKVISKKRAEEMVEDVVRAGVPHLHLHSDGSHLDGMNDIDNLMKRLKEIGAKACTLTDHGNMHQSYRFYKACIENGIKPIIGFEAYMSDARQLQDKKDFLRVVEFMDDDFIWKEDKAHLVLLAENFKGYQNLVKLTSLAFTEGSYVKPRIDYELLRKYNEGVIAINGHVGTDIAKSFERAENPVSQTELEILQENGFKKFDDFYQSYQDNLIEHEDGFDIADENTGKVHELLQEKHDEIEAERKIYREKEINRAYRLNEWYMEVFGDRYYLEIQNHGLNIEKQVTPGVMQLARDHNVPLVMTNDAHYTWKSDADTHRIHMANGTGKTYEEFMGGDFEGFSTCDEFYVKDAEEMAEVALPYGEEAMQALINTHEVVERCNVEIDAVSYQDGKWKTKEYLFPNFSIPAPFNSEEAYFEHLSRKGLEKRKEEDELDLDNYTMEDYYKRLEYEMSVVNDMGFPTYFVILWDVLRFCKERDIPVGKGRGSGAGSLVAYSLNITDIDPLKYNLLFERFLNPHRVSMPDIDLDFCYDRIGEVINYTKEKYGDDKVCKIGTYGTLSAKAVIKDVARVMEYDYVKTNSITTKVQEVGISIDEILNEYDEVAGLYESDSDFKHIIDASRRLEGLQRHTSQHAAGIVISPFPLTDLVPLKGKNGDMTAQFDMEELEELGFVKMDYLRLRTLTVIKNGTNSIYDRLNEYINIDKIDFNDQKVFEKFQEGESLGIFQFESSGMASLLKKQKPTSIEDLSAVNALYRPGPLNYVISDESDPNCGKTMVDVYLTRASGEQEVVYDHPLLEPIQRDTYGVFVYQEQVMKSSVDLAGYSLPESDELRKVISKKKMDKIPIQREKFINGCLNNDSFIKGCKEMNADVEEVAKGIWGQIQTFGEYGFNKSHATAYATLAYQSMWLKTYYPEFFMASVLTSMIGKKIEEIVPYLNEARRLELEVLAPHANNSTLRFEVSDDRKGIHFSLNGIKGAGTKAVENILETKKKYTFRTLSDFIMLTGSAVNKTVVTALSKAGAFDYLGYNRRTTLKMAEDLVAISSEVKKRITANKRRKHPVEDISSFYEPFYAYEVEELEEFSHDELCRMEKELTGFYMTHHPLEGMIDYIQSKATHTSHLINNGIPKLKPVKDPKPGEDDVETVYERLPEGQFVITGGVIKQKKEITIKRGTNKGKKMASIVLEDAYQGDIRCTVFNKQYEQMTSVIQEGRVVFIKGVIDYFNDSPQVNVRELTEVSRESVKSSTRKDLMNELMDVKSTIKDIEETIELLGDDADLIIDVTDELIALYDRLDSLDEAMEEVEMAS